MSGLCRSEGIDAVGVPMGVKADDYPDVLRALFRLTNIRILKEFRATDALPRESSR
jgi:hypothetical protein